MQERVLNNEKIQVHWNTEVTDVIGDPVVEAIKVVNNKTGEHTEIAIKGLFVAIGHQPNTKLFEGWLDMDETGYLITKPGTAKTNIEGVFASGDAQDKVYRQAITAAGTGCMAALDAERYLTEKGII